MYSIYLRPIGEIVVNLATLHIRDAFLHITGHDRNNRTISLCMDRFVCPDDNPNDFGYCKIVSYTMNGTTTPCRVMCSMS